MLSRVWKHTAMGAWLRSSAVCRVCPGTVDEAVSLPGLPCGSYLQAGAIPAGDAIPRSNSEIQPGSKAGRKAVSSSCARQIQQHWWKAFLTRCREAGNWSDPLNFLCQWTGFGQLPVTIRRIYRESWPTVGTPYLCFALTVKKRPFSLE
jgi:hypothetical protein